jgi:hypothetical protein
VHLKLLLYTDQREQQINCEKMRLLTVFSIGAIVIMLGWHRHLVPYLSSIEEYLTPARGDRLCYVEDDAESNDFDQRCLGSLTQCSIDSDTSPVSRTNSLMYCFSSPIGFRDLCVRLHLPWRDRWTSDKILFALMRLYTEDQQSLHKPYMGYRQIAVKKHAKKPMDELRRILVSYRSLQCMLVVHEDRDKDTNSHDSLRRMFYYDDPRGLLQCEQAHLVVRSIPDVLTSWLLNEDFRSMAMAGEQFLRCFLAMVGFEAICSLARLLLKKSGTYAAQILRYGRQNPGTLHKAEEVVHQLSHSPAGILPPSQERFDIAATYHTPHQTAKTVWPMQDEQGHPVKLGEEGVPFGEEGVPFGQEGVLLRCWSRALPRRLLRRWRHCWGWHRSRKHRERTCGESNPALLGMAVMIVSNRQECKE